MRFTKQKQVLNLGMLPRSVLLSSMMMMMTTMIMAITDGKCLMLSSLLDFNEFFLLIVCLRVETHFLILMLTCRHFNSNRCFMTLYFNI